MARDVVTLLEADHRTVERLFEQFKATGDASERARIFERIATELEVHTEVEENYVYPEAERELPAGDELISEAEHEHDEAKRLIREIRAMHHADPRFADMVRRLEGAINHHVEEEEQEMFPQLREEESAERLEEMAEQVERAKQAIQHGRTMPGGANSSPPREDASSRPQGRVDIDLTKEHTKQELYEKAKKAGVKGRSSMTKAELAKALSRQ